MRISGVGIARHGAMVLAFGLLTLGSVGAQTLPSGWKLHPAGTQIAVDTFPMSAVVSPDGKYMLVLNAGEHPPGISVIDLAEAREVGRTPVPDAWLGLTITKAGDKVYVGGGARAAVFEFSFSNGKLSPGRTFPVLAERDRTPQDFVGDVRLAPDGHLLYVANVHRDGVVVMNPQSGLILSRIKTGRRPYRILFHPAGKMMYVSSWADGAIGEYDVNSGERLASIRVAPHPTDMLWVDGGLPSGAQSAGDGQAEVKARMFVAGANTNSVYVLGASETGDLTKLETINLSLTPRQPLGMTPSALGLSADKNLVYIACSDANAVAVIDIAGERNLVKGFVPTAWYPTVVTGLPDGRIGVVNGRSGSVQLIEAPDDTFLGKYTDEVTASSPYRDEMLDAPEAPPGNPVRAGGPIRHVVYVIRDGSPAGAASPNRDKLAHDFASPENLLSLAENSAEGVNWLTAAIAPDYTEKLSPGNASNRRHLYDFEGQDPANVPPAGYLWNGSLQTGLKVRNYGFQVHNRDKPTADGEQVDRVYDPSLAACTDMEYRGPDPVYSDADRAKEFASELGDYGQLGEMPQLLLVRIGSDDQALGIMADALMKSRFWNETAMFVVDARGNPDDHKATALVISPWAKHGTADVTLYNQMSVLRTIEVILGLRPMTTFDAAATPLFGAFANTPAAGR